MSAWKQKRFWNAATVGREGERYFVELDGRRLKTPAKAALELPTQAMADAVAAEWAAQEEVVDPLGMPVTRAANAAIDKVRPQHDDVARMLAEYGDTDLVCYRADAPVELVARQAAAWDPVLDWAQDRLRARLVPRSGIMHQPQDPDALAQLSGRVHRMNEYELAGFHDLVSLSGSLVLGFAALLDWRPADEVWLLSRLDELWQEEQWGRDEDAHALAESKRTAFLHAKRYCDLCQ